MSFLNEEIDYFTRLIAKNSSIEFLDLSANRFNDNAILELLVAVNQNHKLKGIDFSAQAYNEPICSYQHHNQIANAFANLLKANRLQKIHISLYLLSMTENTWEIITDELSKNKSLRFLELSSLSANYNKFFDAIEKNEWLLKNAFILKFGFWEPEQVSNRRCFLESLINKIKLNEVTEDLEKEVLKNIKEISLFCEITNSPFNNYSTFKIDLEKFLFIDKILLLCKNPEKSFKGLPEEIALNIFSKAAEKNYEGFRGDYFKRKSELHTKAKIVHN